MISCIVPSHNASATLVRALRSALTQPGEIEVVLVDDASTDGSAEIAAQAFPGQVASGQLLIVRLASNHGPGLARNMAVAAASGEYLAFLDADDEHLSPYYEACSQWLGEHPEAAGVEVGAEIVDSRDLRTLVDESDPRYLPIINSAPWTAFVRREAFWAAGGFPVSSEFRKALGGEDIVFKTILKQLFSMASTPQKLVRHYVYPGSHTDKYLKRTEIVDGQVVFREYYAEETNRSWDNAATLHIERAKTLYRGLPAMTRAAADAVK